MREFKFLVTVIVLLELAVFACGLKVVSNRHHARALFIELERQQQSYNALLDEKSQLKVELAMLEQPSQVESKAKEKGLVPVDNNSVVVLNKEKAGRSKTEEASSGAKK